MHIQADGAPALYVSDFVCDKTFTTVKNLEIEFLLDSLNFLHPYNDERYFSLRVLTL